MKDPSGLWNALDGAEASARVALAPPLANWHRAYCASFEVGVLAPTLEGARHGAADTLLAAVFLKRTLTDLRGVWNLLSHGYASQAACVAAALYENALLVCCLSGDSAAARIVMEKAAHGMPWSAETLTKRYFEILRLKLAEDGQSTSDDAFEASWVATYAGYKWLCQIKHPTVPSAFHDTRATVGDDGQYSVMAVPTAEVADLPVKNGISFVAVARALDAIGQFVLALDPAQDSDEFRHFRRRYDLAGEAVEEAYIGLHEMDLPFGVGRGKFRDRLHATRRWAHRHL